MSALRVIDGPKKIKRTGTLPCWGPSRPRTNVHETYTPPHHEARAHASTTGRTRGAHSQGRQYSGVTGRTQVAQVTLDESMHTTRTMVRRQRRGACHAICMALCGMHTRKSQMAQVTAWSSFGLSIKRRCCTRIAVYQQCPKRCYVPRTDDFAFVHAPHEKTGARPVIVECVTRGSTISWLLLKVLQGSPCKCFLCCSWWLPGADPSINLFYDGVMKP